MVKSQKVMGRFNYSQNPMAGYRYKRVGALAAVHAQVFALIVGYSTVVVFPLGLPITRYTSLNYMR